MNRLLRVLLFLICLEMGVLLMIVPWTGAWERNYFLERHPALIPYLLNPAFRGAVTGLGMLDVILAAGLLRRRRPTTVATQS